MLLIGRLVAFGQTYGVTTLAGSGTASFADGTEIAASFNKPYGVAADVNGNIYVADTYNNRIRKITPAGVVTTLAGSGTAGFANGTGTAASFYYPTGIAVDATNNIYVADYVNHRIRKITQAGVVTTLAGSGTPGFTDETGTAASFNYPRGVAVDASGNVYVGDLDNNRIRKITSNGVVTTLAGSGLSGYADGTGTNAAFAYPGGVAVDGLGNIYVADQNNRRIRKITPMGVVTTLAGSGVYGNADGTGEAAQFSNVGGVAVDASGNVYVADAGNNLIRKISSSGVVTTITGSGNPAYADGTGNLASFNNPFGVTADANGNVYVADVNNHRIRKIAPCNNVTPTINGNSTYCAGGSTLLTSSSSVGNLWSNGATTQSITVNSVGNYSVIVIEGACTSATSNVLTVTQTSLPATPTISGNTSFCTAGSTVLTSSAASGYIWSTGATTQSITVFTPGSYTVQTIASGCTSAVSASVSVIQNSIPATPTISGNASFCTGSSTVLTSSSATGNLWSN
ncbi:MAG: NHL repeat-containing protein, partial [Flexibacteraceae bacterium]